jgi:hypothetical protein
MRLLRRPRITTARYIIALAILVVTLGRFCLFSWSTLSRFLPRADIVSDYNNRTITTSTTPLSGINISTKEDPPRFDKATHDTERDAPATFTSDSCRCRHWVVATWRTNSTFSSSSSSSSTSIETIRHVAKTIIKDDNNNTGADDDGKWSDWCMVIVTIGRFEPEEGALETTLQAMLFNLTVMHSIHHHNNNSSNNRATFPDKIEGHKTRNGQGFPASSIFILSTQSLMGDDVDDGGALLRASTTSTEMTRSISSTVKTRLKSILTLSSSSSSSPPSWNVLQQQKSNLGNLFALLHGAHSIFELQVDMVQFHSSRTNLWTQVYEMAAKSSQPTNETLETTSRRLRRARKRGGRKRVRDTDWLIQIGLAGTHVWNPYLTGTSTVTTKDNSNDKGEPWYGVLPAAFEAPFQAQAQQVAYREPNGKLFFENALGYNDDHVNSTQIKDDDSGLNRKQIKTTKIGTISFVIQPPSTPSSSGESGGGGGGGGGDNADKGDFPVLIPSHVSCPYTTYATWHLQPTLWSLVLPPSLITPTSDYNTVEHFRAFTTRYLLQDYNVNLLVVQAHSHQTTLSASMSTGATSSITDTPSGQYPQSDRETTRQEGEDEIYRHQPSPEDKISHLLDWLHHTYVPTAVSPLSQLGHFATTTPTSNLAWQMEAMWVALHKMAILTNSDIVLVQKWIQALIAMNYKFPTQKRYKQYNVAAMGQFNIAPRTSARTVMYWVQHLKRYFYHVAVAGAFSPGVKNELESYGMLVVPYESRDDMGRDKGKQRGVINDRGYFSPMDNLAWTLQYYQNQSQTEMSRRHGEGDVYESSQIVSNLASVKGVLYLHDDALINVKEWMKSSGNERPPASGWIFPTDAIIASRGKGPPARIVYQPSKASVSSVKYNRTDAAYNAARYYLSQYSYNIHVALREDMQHLQPDSLAYYFTNALGERFNSTTELLTQSPLRPFPWYSQDCIPGQVRIVQTAAVHFFASKSSHLAMEFSRPPPGFDWNMPQKYDFRSIFQTHHHPDPSTVDVSLRFPCRGQSDLLFVPMSVSKEFSTAVAMHTGSTPKVFLECAMPTIVDMVYQVTRVPVRLVALCTDWTTAVRGSEEMVWDCIRYPYQIPLDNDGNQTSETKDVDSGSGEIATKTVFEAYGIFHPFKLSASFERWSDMFDAVNNA